MPIRKKTKIVATLGPATSKKDILKSMLDEGVDVFRINFSHADYSDVSERIKMIRELNEEFGYNAAILGDLQGPKLRVGVMKEEVVVNPPDPPNPIDTNTVTSTSQIINKEVVVYPNPMEQQLQILFPSEVKNGQISLLDVQGRIVWQRNYVTATTNHLTADISHLTSGIYYVKIRMDGVDMVKKVLKM